MDTFGNFTTQNEKLSQSNVINIYSLSLSGSLEIIQCLLDSFGHSLLTFTNPHPRIKVFLIRFIVSIWISNLRREVCFLRDHVVPDSSTIGVLQISVEIDFDDAERDRFVVFLFCASTTSVEYKETRISLCSARRGTEASHLCI